VSALAPTQVRPKKKKGTTTMGRALLSLVLLALASFVTLVLIGLWDRYSRETAALGFWGAYERYQASLAGFPDDPKAYRAALSDARRRQTGAATSASASAPLEE
jgi:hypothetical protein